MAANGAGAALLPRAAGPYPVAMRKPGLNHLQLLRFAGLFQYASVGVPFLRYRALVEDLAWKQLPTVYAPLWLACYIVFGLVFWYLTADLGRGYRSPAHRVLQIGLLLVLNAMAVAIGWFSQSGIAALLLAVVAVVLPWLLSVRAGVIWLVVQNFSLVPVFASIREPAFSLGDAVLQSSLYLGFTVLAFATSLIMRRQVEARDEQRRLNAELVATRALLAESSRLGERMRISRELHDLVGHHLTALSLHLEVASHLVEGRAQEHVRRAQSVARLLLGDVREVVSQLREDGEIDLSMALRSLVQNVPGLQVHLDLPPGFSVADPERAHVLLRCAQEIITNAMRHAGARNLWLGFSRRADGSLAMHARDDGRGASDFEPGNGLAGMRERLAQFGGQLRVATAPGEGFTLDAQLPMENPA